MVVEEYLVYNACFDDEETKVLHEAKKILQKLHDEMERRNLDTFKCAGEFTYDITSLTDTVENLSMFIELSEILA